MDIGKMLEEDDAFEGINLTETVKKNVPVVADKMREMKEWDIDSLLRNTAKQLHNLGVMGLRKGGSEGELQCAVGAFVFIGLLDQKLKELGHEPTGVELPEMHAVGGSKMDKLPSTIRQEIVEALKKKLQEKHPDMKLHSREVNPNGEKKDEPTD